MSVLFTVVLSLSFFSFSVQAEKKIFQVKGMHCAGCVQMMEGEVCEAQDFKTCKVSLVNGKKNTGQIELETKDNAPIDMVKLKAKIQEAGEQYSLVE